MKTLLILAIVGGSLVFAGCGQTPEQEAIQSGKELVSALQQCSQYIRSTNTIDKVYCNEKTQAAAKKFHDAQFKFQGISKELESVALDITMETIVAMKAAREAEANQATALKAIQN